MSRFRRSLLSRGLIFGLLALSLLAGARGADAYRYEEVALAKCETARGMEDYYGALLWDAYNDDDPANDDEYLDEYQYWLGEIGRWC
jgi:hypothetical protein